MQGSELEDTKGDMSGELVVAALDEEVNQLLQLGKVELDDALLPMLASASEGFSDSGNNGNHVESASGTGTSTWYKGRYSLCRRLSLCVQADIKVWNMTESCSIEINTY